MERKHIILHGTWFPMWHCFWIWGEVADAPRRKGGQRKIPSHPFHATPDALRERLRDIPYEKPLLPNLETYKTHQQTLWLPTIDKLPLPSPGILATGAIPLPEGESVLAPWNIEGILLPTDATIDLLLNLAENREIGDDVRTWRLATLLAMEMVAGQYVLPALQRDGYEFRAVWLPRPSPIMRDRLVRLVHSLPPICRAAVDNSEKAPPPRALLDDFITTIVDITVRKWCSDLEIEKDIFLDREMNTPSAGGEWVAALIGTDPTIRLKGPGIEALYASWRKSMEESDVAGDDVFRITFRLEPPPHQQAPWKLEYLLQATDDPSLLVPASHIWHERGSTFTYLNRRFDRPQERLLCGLGYAARIFPPMEESLRTRTPDHALLTVNEAFQFLKDASILLEQSGFVVLVPSWWQGGGMRLRAKGRASADQSQENGKAALSMDKILSFKWDLALGNATIDPAEFEKLVALKQPLVQVRGQWMVLDPEQMERILQFFKEHEGKISYAEVLRIGLSGHGMILPTGIEGGEIEGSGWIGEVLRGLRETHRLDLLDTPTGLRGTLRPYQRLGYAWLAFMRRFGIGACLADDMGLGKTIQTIALLLYEREQIGITAPALIVCPTSVVSNWQREIEKFAPSLRILVHQGNERQQKKAFYDMLSSYDVVLTSFALLSRDRDTLTGVEWATVVLDEAQNIKNSSTKQAQAARKLHATTRIALTGTPVENRLSELWSIFAFLNPGYLGSLESFLRDYARPIERTQDPNATIQLKQLTAPFILRRLKTDKTIIDDLPEKIETKAYCPLSPEQATLYEATVQDGFKQVKESERDNDSKKRRGHVLALLMKLKQICNHPAQFLKDGSDLPDRSGKLDRLTEMLEEVYETENRALIFTQFAEMGKMLQNYLSERFYEEVLFLHGGTTVKHRDAMVRQFQSPRGPTVFILSLKAGGTGLNLTKANHVFHFDRWWNPAVEKQATDRAFRIGQIRNVQVHTFICSGTLEEHIDTLIENKRGLAESVLGTGENWLTELTTEQLHELVALKQIAARAQDREL